MKDQKSITSLFIFHFTFTIRRKEVDSVGRLKDSTCKTSHFWLEILLKMKSMKISNFGSKLLPEIGYF